VDEGVNGRKDGDVKYKNGETAHKRGHEG